MSTIIQGTQREDIVWGTKVTKATGTLTSADVSLFTVAGGRAVVTSLIGEVTVAVTVANASLIKLNPTVAADTDLCAALDIGTTDTPVGHLLSITGTAADAMVRGAGVPMLATEIIVMEGVIEHESAGTDGEVTWTLTYVPYDDGATIVAA